MPAIAQNTSHNSALRMRGRKDLGNALTLPRYCLLRRLAIWRRPLIALDRGAVRMDVVNPK